jgi:hypothetical protein
LKSKWYFREQRIIDQVTHCYKCLGLKLLLIAAVSLFINTRGGAGVQVAACVSARSVLVEQWPGAVRLAMRCVECQVSNIHRVLLPTDIGDCIESR